MRSSSALSICKMSYAHTRVTAQHTQAMPMLKCCTKLGSQKHSCQNSRVIKNNELNRYDISNTEAHAGSKKATATAVHMRMHHASALVKLCHCPVYVTHQIHIIEVRVLQRNIIEGKKEEGRHPSFYILSPRQAYAMTALEQVPNARFQERG